MPLYEYACEKCGKVFEVMQRFADAPLTQHEGCGGKVERLLSAPALHFKGSGFYITDYAKGNSSPSSGKSSSSESSKSETPSSSGKDSSSSSSNDSSSKPAATPSTTKTDSKS